MGMEGSVWGHHVLDMGIYLYIGKISLENEIKF
jgi:hypothetical protein